MGWGCKRSLKPQWDSLGSKRKSQWDEVVRGKVLSGMGL